MKIDFEIVRYQDHELKVSHHKVPDPKGTVFCFPGAGYNYMGPCLYYTSSSLMQKGFNILNFEYDFRAFRLNEDTVDGHRDFFHLMMEYGSKISETTNKMALAKSIGTKIIATDEQDSFDKIIWLTPLIHEDFVQNQIIHLADKSLVLIGSEDPCYKPELISAQRDANVRVKLIDGADHSFDIPGDVQKSIIRMNSIVDTVKSFV